MQVVFVIVLVLIAALIEVAHTHELRRLHHLGTEVIQPPYLHGSTNGMTAIRKSEYRGCLSVEVVDTRLRWRRSRDGGGGRSIRRLAHLTLLLIHIPLAQDVAKVHSLAHAAALQADG